MAPRASTPVASAPRGECMEGAVTSGPLQMEGRREPMRTTFFCTGTRSCFRGNVLDQLLGTAVTMATAKGQLASGAGRGCGHLEPWTRCPAWPLLMKGPAWGGSKSAQLCQPGGSRASPTPWADPKGHTAPPIQGPPPAPRMGLGSGPSVLEKGLEPRFPGRRSSASQLCAADINYPLTTLQAVITAQLLPAVPENLPLAAPGRGRRP